MSTIQSILFKLQKMYNFFNKTFFWFIFTIIKILWYDYANQYF